MCPSQQTLRILDTRRCGTACWAQRLPHIKILTLAFGSLLSHQGSTVLFNTCLFGLFTSGAAFPNLETYRSKLAFLGLL